VGNKIRLWLILFAVITGLLGTIYLGLQQNYRLSANDPQIQMSEDLSRKLENGEQDVVLVSKNYVDIASSLSTFIIVYDEFGRVSNSNARLDGKVPEVPKGVLNYVKVYGQRKVTWSPAPGVRIAAVINKFNGTKSGYVLVGRSLREVEKRIDLLTFQVGVGYFVTIFTISFLIFILPTEKKIK
jgi:hypothetical protein